MNTLLLSARDLMLRAGAAVLLDGVTLDLRRGEVLGIVGPNGAGKSSLLKILAGVRKADAGTVLLAGKTLGEFAPMHRARMLAYLEQRPVVHWPLTVRQVVALGRLPHGTVQGAAATRAIDAALAATDAFTLQERSFHTLSEGEKMRVNLARVLATEPQVMLADEPTAALDPWHQLQLLELLCTLATSGLGIVLVLHDLALAARFCDRLLLLDKGHVMASGAPHEVLNASTLAAVYRIEAELLPDGQGLITKGRVD